MVKFYGPRIFFIFFPILAVILHFFGLDSKSVHSAAHPYHVGVRHCALCTVWAICHTQLERSDSVLFYKLGESLRTLQEWGDNYPF
jgi:hypothetical protein